MDVSLLLFWCLGKLNLNYITLVGDVDKYLSQSVTNIILKSFFRAYDILHSRILSLKGVGAIYRVPSHLNVRAPSPCGVCDKLAVFNLFVLPHPTIVSKRSGQIWTLLPTDKNWEAVEVFG